MTYNVSLLLDLAQCLSFSNSRKYSLKRYHNNIKQNKILREGLMQKVEHIPKLISLFNVMIF